MIKLEREFAREKDEKIDPKCNKEKLDGLDSEIESLENIIQNLEQLLYEASQKLNDKSLDKGTFRDISNQLLLKNQLTNLKR